MKINYINESIGVRLRDLRERAGFSLQDVAERVGLSRYTYYNFERGRRTISLDLLKRLCMIYGEDYLALLEEVRQEYIEYVKHNENIVLQELEDGDK